MMFAYELERRAKAAKLPISVHVCHPGAARTTLAKEEANGMTKFLLRYCRRLRSQPNVVLGLKFYALLKKISKKLPIMARQNALKWLGHWRVHLSAGCA